MRYSLIFTLIIGFKFIAYSQDCGNDFDLKKLKHENPKAYQEFLRIEKLTEDYVMRMKGASNQRLIDPNGTITIPLVIHVLHLGETVGTGTNLSDNRINTQIDILNQCYSQTNDQNAVPFLFRNIAGNPNIRFVLACRSPNGSVTNGILRKQVSASTNFDQSLNNAKNSSEGDSPWPTERYLNIWITPNLFSLGTLFGYSSTPDNFSQSPELDGVVIRFDAFGTGTGTDPARTEGRTLVHEIGHWLNLLHLFQGGCSGNDFCNDTPLQDIKTDNQLACNTIVFPYRVNNCFNTPNGVMFDNFMDNTSETCGRRMFTQDQSLRMRALFQQGGIRSSFIDNYFKLVFSGYRNCIEEFDYVVSPFCAAAGNINWSITGPAYFGNPQGFSTYVNPFPNTNGEATLTASWNNFTSDLKIPVGWGSEKSIYRRTNSSNPTNIYSGGFYSATNSTSGTISFSGATTPGTNWRVVSQSGSATFFGSGNNFNVNVSQNANITLAVDFSTACGLKTTQFTFYRSSYQFLLSPNPASNSITIAAASISTNPDPNVRTTSEVPEYEVQIFTRYNQLMKKMKCDKGAKDITIDVSNLPSNQLYTVQLISSEGVEIKSFFKE
jgi:Pregnancy-associated plasma protein-A